mgnify:CR=1 FL=1
MAKAQHQVGDVIESQCRRCNDRTGHNIVALVEGEVSKVECRVCGSLHKHRPSKASAGAKKSTRARSSSAQSKSKKSKKPEEPVIDSEWQRQMEGRNPADALPYSMEGRFRPRDLLDHPQFGTGVVQKIVQQNKMNVIFQDGLKQLRCGPEREE